MPLASRQIFTPACTHTRIRVHTNTCTCRWTCTCTRTSLVCTQISRHCSSSYSQMEELHLNSTSQIDSDLPSVLDLSLTFIFTLMWPAAVVVAHAATQRHRKEWAILCYTKMCFPLTMQWKCCSNITDNHHYLKERTHCSSAGMSRSGLIALYFTS